MGTSLQLKADSYLEHMLVAARVGDKSLGLWRNMLDNWNCYSRGHPFVTSGGAGQPHWFNKATSRQFGEALRMMHRRSVQADFAMSKSPDECLAVDHAVPVNVLRDVMIEVAQTWNGKEEVRKFLEQWYRLCVITQGEHKRLNGNAFHRGRVDPTRIFERYALAGIELVS